MRETLALSLVVFAGYVGAAFGVTNAFPFSTFPMFSEAAPTSGARLIVRDGAGEHHEIERYVDWACEGELEAAKVEMAMCPDGELGHATGYLVQESLDYMRANAGEGGEPVELVIHVWRLDRPERVELDCFVARCRAVRR
ncbi:hypothetical protein ACNOYE_06755 [Nannocystaceae bacterium ST9]